MESLYPDASARFNGSVFGKADFFQMPKGVLIKIHVHGLPLENVTDFFALHIHEGNSCDNGFSKTGGHYNPLNMSHPRHSGDLPPLLSNGGEAYMTVLTNRFTLDEVTGKAIVIHSDSDDFYSQPAGNPGIKIACAIIEKNKS